ncbi:MAG: hypothetical protein WKF73_21800 [Nocardioidaceae bacterium]
MSSSLGLVDALRAADVAAVISGAGPTVLALGTPSRAGRHTLLVPGRVDRQSAQGRSPRCWCQAQLPRRLETDLTSDAGHAGAREVAWATPLREGANL